jgi:hypothetical protein
LSRARPHEPAEQLHGSHPSRRVPGRAFGKSGNHDRKPDARNSCRRRRGHTDGCHSERKRLAS